MFVLILCRGSCLFLRHGLNVTEVKPKQQNNSNTSGVGRKKKERKMKASRDFIKHDDLSVG